MKNFLSTIAVILLQVLLTVSVSSAQLHRPIHHHEFEVPPGLRARVNFWKDVFAKYGKNQVVIHHREFPQATFMVLDFRVQAAELGPVALDSLKTREVKRRIDEVKDAMRVLASGARPATPLQERIEKQMAFIRGGISKYKRAIDEDLVRSQTGVRDKFEEAIKRSGRYLPVIEKVFVQDYGIPVEVTRLPFVESSFDYTAYSAVGAAGIWQFMPRTARLYMSVNNLVDERRDPIESSQAAARYLASAYNRIGTWPLTITSYNHGVAGVISKARKAGTTDIVKLIESQDEKDRPFGFASSNFYPSLLAAIEVYDERHMLFPGIEPEPALRIAKVRIPEAVSVVGISHQLGCPVESLKEVNYALADRIWDGKSAIPSGYILKVPMHCAARIDQLRFVEIRAPEPIQTASSIYGGQVYKVKKGDTLASIGKKYGVSTEQLARLNRLEKGKVKVGQTLVIKLRERPIEDKKPAAQKPASGTSRKETIVKAEDVGQGKKGVGAQPMASSETYKVGPGDTLYSISRKFGVSPEKLKEINKLSSTNLHVAQVLKIPAVATAKKEEPKTKSSGSSTKGQNNEKKKSSAAQANTKR